MIKITNLLATLLSVFSLISCGQSLSQLPKANLQFPEKQDQVIIPFELDRNWIVLRVKVNSTELLSFVLDTGSPISVINDSSKTRPIDLKIGGHASGKGDDGTQGVSVPLATGVQYNWEN